jgi:predicted SnoaL-like aldol condensation-catalyzing enzyme
MDQKQGTRLKRLHLSSGCGRYTLARDPEISPSLPKKGVRPMSVEENKTLVRRYLESGRPEAMRGNLDVVHQYFADHYHDHTSMHPEQPGVQGVKEIIADWGQATPDLRHEVLDIAAEEDLVFVHWRGTATHEGQHQMTKHVRDIEPTGEEATVSGISLYRIEGGKFVESWHYHDVLEYALARGMAGAPGDSS